MLGVGARAPTTRSGCPNHPAASPFGRLLSQSPSPRVDVDDLKRPAPPDPRVRTAQRDDRGLAPDAYEPHRLVSVRNRVKERLAVPHRDDAAVAREQKPLVPGTYAEERA